MILDRLENLRCYAALFPYLDKVADFISAHDLASLPVGRVEIDGSDCYANVDIAHGKTREEAVMETHDRMIDVQLVIGNHEEIGWSHRSQLSKAHYNAERDFTLYPGQMPSQYVTLHEGEFAIFTPTDAHAPCISHREEYRKVIFKMRVIP